MTHSQASEDVTAASYLLFNRSQEVVGGCGGGAGLWLEALTSCPFPAHHGSFPFCLTFLHILQVHGSGWLLHASSVTLQDHHEMVRMWADAQGITVTSHGGTTLCCSFRDSASELLQYPRLHGIPPIDSLPEAHSVIVLFLIPQETKRLKMIREFS